MPNFVRVGYLYGTGGHGTGGHGTGGNRCNDTGNPYHFKSSIISESVWI
jgi:hypothetical protein